MLWHLKELAVTWQTEISVVMFNVFVYFLLLWLLFSLFFRLLDYSQRKWFGQTNGDSCGIVILKTYLSIIQQDYHMPFLKKEIFLWNIAHVRNSHSLCENERKWFCQSLEFFRNIVLWLILAWSIQCFNWTWHEVGHKSVHFW